MRQDTTGVAPIETTLGGRVVRSELMSRHTTLRIGGPADLFIEATSADDLRDIVLLARRSQVQYFILGAGSNLLVSDAGIRGLVILNKARQIKFQDPSLKSQTRVESWGGDPDKASTWRVQVESGVILPTLARECIERGLTGLEWSIGVPGTVGGAVVGNAGAHGSDTARSLVSATILDAEGSVRDWSPAELQFSYRSSVLKPKTSALRAASGQPTPLVSPHPWETHTPGKSTPLGNPHPWEIHTPGKSTPLGNPRGMGHGAWGMAQGAGVSNRPVVLAAEFELKPSTPEECEARAAGFTEKRKRTQPPGATIGSMFKNPPGGYAGQLIEAAGLKGARAGNAEISGVHANFFVNLGGASAADMVSLIHLAREKVKTMCGVELELEIQLVGEE